MSKFCKGYAKVMWKHAWILLEVSGSDSATGEARSPVMYYRPRHGKHTSFGKMTKITDWFSQTTRLK